MPRGSVPPAQAALTSKPAPGAACNGFGAVYRLHDPVSPFPGGLVRHPAELGRRVELHVVAHEADEEDPGEEGLLRALENGPVQVGEVPAAFPAKPALVAGRRRAGLDASVRPAIGAGRQRAPFAGGGIVVADADLLAAFPGLDCLLQQGEIGARKRIDLTRERVRLAHMAASCPRRRPSSQDVAKHRTRWPPAHIYVWRANPTTSAAYLSRYP